MTEEVDKPEEPETNEVVLRLLKGEKNAFTEVVGAYEVPVREFVQKQMRTADDTVIHDVTQTVWIEVMKCLPAFDRKKRFLPWVIGVARNVCSAAKKRRRRDRHDSFASDPAAGQSSPAELVAADVDLKKALAEMPRDELSALKLKWEHKFTCAEIGESLGISESSAQRLLQAAKERIQRHLEGWAQND